MHQEREVEDKISRGYHQEKVRCTVWRLGLKENQMEEEWQYRHQAPPPPPPPPPHQIHVAGAEYGS